MQCVLLKGKVWWCFLMNLKDLKTSLETPKRRAALEDMYVNSYPRMHDDITQQTSKGKVEEQEEQTSEYKCQLHIQCTAPFSACFCFFIIYRCCCYYNKKVSLPLGTKTGSGGEFAGAAPPCREPREPETGRWGPSVLRRLWAAKLRSFRFADHPRTAWQAKTPCRCPRFSKTIAPSGGGQDRNHGCVLKKSTLSG